MNEINSETVEDIKAVFDPSDNDMAITFYVDIAQRGGTWEDYEALAEESLSVDDDQYTALIFADGSSYADFEQGINRFYPPEMLGDLFDKINHKTFFHYKRVPAQ